MMNKNLEKLMNLLDELKENSDKACELMKEIAEKLEHSKQQSKGYEDKAA